MSKLITMDYIDSLTGREFELFTGDLLRILGYRKVKVTRPSGDHGLDVIATDKTGNCIGVQCKHLGPNECVGYKAVEETYTGKSMYGTNEGVILTNRVINSNATKASKHLGLKCWDRNFLAELVAVANNINYRSNAPVSKHPITKIIKRPNHLSDMDWGLTINDVKLLNLVRTKSIKNNYKPVKFSFNHLKNFLGFDKHIPYKKALKLLNKIIKKTEIFSFNGSHSQGFILLFQHNSYDKGSRLFFSFKLTHNFENLINCKKVLG